MNFNFFLVLCKLWYTCIVLKKYLVAYFSNFQRVFVRIFQGYFQWRPVCRANRFCLPIRRETYIKKNLNPFSSTKHTIFIRLKNNNCMHTKMTGVVQIIFIFFSSFDFFFLSFIPRKLVLNSRSQVIGMYIRVDLGRKTTAPKKIWKPPW